MRNMKRKKILACLCAIALLLNMIVLPGGAVTTQSNTLTFSDFGMDDMTHVKDAYIGTLTNGTSLDGKTFEGYFTMGDKTGNAWHSIRIGTTGSNSFNGIGFRANDDKTTWEIRNFDQAGGYYGTTLKQVTLADYGITYTKGVGFSEVKLTMSWDFVDGTKDAKVVIKLNDKECFNGVVAGLQNNIGTKIYIQCVDEVPISIRSVVAPMSTPVIKKNLTFTDMQTSAGAFDTRWENGTKAKGAQNGGIHPNITTGADLDGVAFNGSIALGKPGSPLRYQSIRIGGSTTTNGIGFTPIANGVIRLYHYAAEDKGVVLKEIKAADYGITYDETNGYGAFDFRIAYQNIPNTTNTFVTVTVNNKACYEGVIVNGQTVLGNRAWLFAWTSPITITSVTKESDPDVGGEDEDIEVTTFEKLTFSDFDMDDLTHVKDAYTGSLLAGTSLNGKIFEGYFTMGFKNGNSYHSVRIGTKDGDAFSGIGIRARDAQTWEIRNFSGNSGGTSLVENLVISDYGITCENNSFSEVKLTMSWDFVEGTKDVKVVMKLNDKECFNGVVAGLQNNIGTKLFVWSYNEVPISVRSVVAPMPTPVIKENLTFTDMQTAAGVFDTRWENGTKAKGAQNGGIHPNITTGADLNGIAFNGNVALGLPGSPLRYQSLRIGGSTATNGIGFTPIANGVIRLYHYSAEDKGIVLKEIKAADYGIAYDETNGYGAFDFRITYQNIPNTKNTWITVTINDKACYEGVIVNGQTVLGNRAWLFAWTSPITITSVTKESDPDVGGEDEDIEVTTFEKLTFSDFGVDDLTHVKDAYTSSLPEGTSLNGKIFEGYITMGLMASPYHSVRIGTTALASGLAWNGIGIRAHSADEWEIGNYNVAGGSGGGYTSLTGRLNAADYGITYDAATNMFSKVKLTMSWDYVEGTKDIKVVMKLNDKECFNGTVSNLQNNIGTNIFLWSYNDTPISVHSVATKPTEGNVKNVTFEDLGFEDGTKDPTHQKGGTFLNVTTGADLDGVVFNGKVAMGKPATGSQPMRYQSIRIGGSTVTNGIGFTPVANGVIRLYHYSAEDKGIILKEIKAADYGISYDEATGYGVFDFRITYQNIPDTTNTWVTVTVNNKACYEGVIANGQSVLGNRAWLFAYTSPITITSVAIYPKVDFTEFGFTDNWAVELGLKKEGK